ncbi:hypothetical protein SAMD00019534_097730 [Acytostelium subglobosum LB1]|uniref:hypothetical protein n=1 Tax=Acytostelium subglobosum LB1 TaxID=1410327 RepID=UPI000644E8DE|nr:hypothetical protein SAMD00019534_097730 [Acytostelium subglobosum LB1]GAM26598.1 hypothetical protein SAMD00019534_097730 [Acytostelium subglobosum LB1]|eukprot:XP_012750259.1 hypothetical protein SAMD00019534_097730 [Acytostelium subglobosum LB1]
MSDSPTKRLQTLRDLLDKKLIDQSQFDDAQKKILNELTNPSQSRGQTHGLLEWLKVFGKPGPKKQNYMSTYGANFPFVGRDTALDAISDATVRRWKNRHSTDQKSHPILVAAGAPGIGKTRLLREFPKRISSTMDSVCPDHVDLHISFGNGTSFEVEFSNTIQPQDLISTALSMRILYSYLSLSVDYFVLLSDWRRQFPNMAIPLSTALECIRQEEKKKFIAVYLGVDEFQKLLTESKDPKKQLLKILTHIVGTFQASASPTIFLVTVFAGTIYSPLMEIFAASSFKHERINLPLLSNTTKKNDVRTIVWSTKFKDYLHLDSFKYALMFVGGWPRLIEILLDTMDMEGTPMVNSFEVFRDLLVSTRKEIKKYYSFDSCVHMVPHLVAWSVTCKIPDNWQLDSPIPNGTTFEELEHIGMITHLGSHVAFPLIYVDWCSHSLKKTPFILLFELLHSFEEENFWQNWEKFCARLLLIKLVMFTHLYNIGVHPRLPTPDPNSVVKSTPNVTLSELFTPSSRYTKEEKGFQTKKIVLNYQDSRVIKLDHKFPSGDYRTYFNQKGCLDGSVTRVYLNAQSAPFDFFLFFEDADNRTLIAGQAKLKMDVTTTQPSNVTDDVAEEWFKSIESIKAFDPSISPILCIFTNDDAEVDMDLTINTIVVDAKSRYYSPIFRNILQYFTKSD